MAPDAEVTYVDGSDPVAAAKAAAGADVAIVFATQWTTEAEDAQSLSLPHDQDALIAAVAKANRNSVVVLETGGPVLMPWLDKVPAVIEAWYPEIGRASCRERVCQYGLVSGVALSLKKKHHK